MTEMVERVQDLNLPLAIVARLIKDVLPDGINVSKEARQAISRAASVFVIYLSAAATTAAKNEKQKLLTPQNVFDALNEIEFENFIQPLKESLEVYRKNIREKRENKNRQDKLAKKGDAQKNKSSTNADEEQIDEHDDAAGDDDTNNNNNNNDDKIETIEV